MNTRKFPASGSVAVLICTRRHPDRDSCNHIQTTKKNFDAHVYVERDPFGFVHICCQNKGQKINYNRPSPSGLKIDPNAFILL